MLIKCSKISIPNKYIVVPSNIFDDERLSIGAKGLYCQIYHNYTNLSSFEDISELSVSSKEDIIIYADELNKYGYITEKNGVWSLNEKPTLSKNANIDKKLDNTTTNRDNLLAKYTKQLAKVENDKEKLKTLLIKCGITDISEEVIDCIDKLDTSDKNYAKAIKLKAYITTNQKKADELKAKIDEMNKSINILSEEKVKAEENRKDRVDALSETVVPKEDSLHNRIVKLIESYSLDSVINNFLIEFFDHWIFREGRYSEAYKINETNAQRLINELLSFNLSNDEMLDCIKLSIDKQYYQFINPKESEQKQISPEEILKKITGIITTKYTFSNAVNTALIEYFTKRVNKEGRFAEAEDLHGPTVHSLLISLRDFNMNDAELINCIKTSTDKEYFKFIDNRSNNTTSTFKPFDKSTLTSGSYTEEDIRRIKEAAAAAAANKSE